MKNNKFDVDHIVITQFRNDKTQPTLFANAAGEFISISDKKDFAKANDEGNLKLSLKQAEMVVETLPADTKMVEISPAFTLDQFKALISK